MSITEDKVVRRKIRVWGIVQGVGFRPTVYRLAIERQLSGFILNNGQGVYIEIEGGLSAADSFITALKTDAPPLSRIDRVSVDSMPLQNDGEFVITSSDTVDLDSISISPDKGVCSHCMEETFTAGNRHYQYPFTNCTHCGPRYSLVRQLPYDRPWTSMADFAMCPACAEAYGNPLDRRYHAQPVSCNYCGPEIRFTDSSGNLLANRDKALMHAVAALKDGKIVAVKGIGGFHLMCDATNEEVVARLRAGKRRLRKPLAVMVNSLEMAASLAVIDPLEQEILESPERPITLLQKRLELALAESIAPGVPWLGVMLAYSPLHYLLMESLKFPLVATSANVSGMPIATRFSQVIEQLGQHIDYVLDHNRNILHACDDSVVQVAGGRRQVLRLGRGYAPLVMPLEQAVDKPLLALGVQQKNSIALARGKQMVVGPYQGDLDSLEMEASFSRHLNDIEQLFEIEPATVISDKHPHYITTRMAQDLSKERSLSHLQVQHHHAHILAVMAEHRLTGEVLGFAFDGTGYGDPSPDGKDGNTGVIWGGEVLLVDIRQAKRCHYLKPFRLIGGERAIKEPARILLGLLLEYYSLDEIKALDLPAFKGKPASWLNNLYKVWQSPGLSPLTTSMGRMIDGWASLLGLVDTVDFEGECGLRLEAAAIDAVISSHPEARFNLSSDGVIQWHRLLDWAIDQRTRKTTGHCAVILLTAIARMIGDIAHCYPNHSVVVSGGVFQNRILMNNLAMLFQSKKRSLLTSEQLPPNDGGISAGQLWHGLMSGACQD
ncbi:carbamoyltransferase HypF [Endozoicomonas sp. Mp262]|uniref:carbamoyltransferase HypF n=1 Tax=Endozoicomonas sp. Mp262 TaxID=2919499 RepID=UPI0021D8C519